MRQVLFGFALACSISYASADEFGVATYYRNPWHGGLIAAHPSLPFGTRVRVHNLDNGLDVTVVIVDRGPFARGRIIDISTVAADVLGMRQSGIARVRLERLSDVAGGDARQGTASDNVAQKVDVHVSGVSDPEIAARMIGAHTAGTMVGSLMGMAR